MTPHPLQASPTFAEEQFGFLLRLGYTLEERWVTGGDSFRDGWRLTFAAPAMKVIVQYLDAQFEVHFVRARLDASYLEIDRDMYARRSGFHGDMFPPEKLAAAITRIAADIEANYVLLLSGGDGEWTKIAQLKAQPPKRPYLP